jgi:coenzyme F420-reducing hydrogenase beta subunit
MLEQKLRQTCRELLANGTVKVIIGYGAAPAGQATRAVFITTPEGVEQLVWNDRCEANLVAYLKRPEVRALGKPAIVVKACDERALVVLQQEAQLERANVFVIGMACDGIGAPREAKCRSCEDQVPRFCDVVLGEVTKPADAASARWDELAEFMKKSPEERMAYWQQELARA